MAVEVEAEVAVAGTVADADPICMIYGEAFRGFSVFLTRSVAFLQKALAKIAILVYDI